jgi:putative ABC transport system permease protein
MARNMGFTVLVVLTLGLGIGATTVIFSVFNAVVLRSLPFPQSEQLVRVREISPHGNLFSISEPNFLYLYESSRSFSHLVAVAYRSMTLIGDGEPQRVSGMGTTRGLFTMLGTDPSLGVTFSPADFELGNESRVTIISHGLWDSRFGRDPDVIGAKLNLDGTSRVIVGVMPETLRSPIAVDVWIPVVPDPASERAEHRLEAFGRLRPGVSLTQAREDVARLADHLGTVYPQSNAGWGVSLVTFREWLIGERATRVAAVLLGAVGLLLLLGCASVSNLLLARATTRHREVALRASLGANRSRIAGQLIVESLTLAMLGAGVGLLAAVWAIPVIQQLETSPLPRLDEVTIDRTVLGATMLVTLIVGLICGIAPALQASRNDLSAVMKEAGQMVAGRARRTRDGLVIAQLALAVMLLVGAGLLTNSFMHLLRTDPGIETSQVLLVELTPPADAYPELSREVAILYRDLLTELEAVPGVTAAGASMVSPLSGTRPANFVGAEGNVAEQNDMVSIQWRAVTPGFFDALGVSLIAGRFFDQREASAENSPFVEQDANPNVTVVINQSLAAILWPPGEAVGQRVVWNSPTGTTMNVVGVVGDISDVTYPEEQGPTVYLSHSIVPWPTMTLMIQTAGDPTNVAGAVRSAIWSVDDGVPVPLMVTMQDALEGTALSGPRLNMLLLSMFAAAALGLAALGIYGITVYSVTSRTREIGVRMALGAGPGAIVGMVFSREARIIVSGTVLGLVAAFALARFLTSLLYEIRPTDLATYGLATLVITGVALTANYLPARRATRIDPRVAFTTE